MKKTFLIWCVFSFILSATAQDNYPFPVKRLATEKVTFFTEDSNTILIPMKFNDAESAIRKLKIDTSRIQSVSLLFTRYRLSENFSQEELNIKRINNLCKLIPSLKTSKRVMWYEYEQTGCDNPHDCRDFFHGFVIYMTPSDVMKYKASELALLDYYTSFYEGSSSTESIDSLIRTGTVSLVKRCDTILKSTPIYGSKMPRCRSWDKDLNKKLASWIDPKYEKVDTLYLEYEMDEKGNFTTLHYEDQLYKANRVKSFLKRNARGVAGRYRKERLPSLVIAKIYKTRHGLRTSIQAVPIVEGMEEFEAEGFMYHTSREETCDYIDTGLIRSGISWLSRTQNIVLPVFERNKQWQNCVIVTDVTGSMFPYLAQFQTWHKKNLQTDSSNNSFVFFNDGDNMPDILKKTGEVGGLYYIKTSDYSRLTLELRTAMTRGGGGDIPENNIEAALHGLKMNPKAQGIIMIADNNATPRDLELLNQLKVPVHLILCGTQHGINPEYLNLVRRTKGSLHTIEEDLTQFYKISEGQTIQIDGFTYKLVKGRFVMISRT